MTLLRLTRVSRCFGKPLYGSHSTLPTDFYACCKNHFNIQLHEGTYIGIRSSQQRGLFLSPDRSKPLASNTPIATIPLASLYTVSNIHTKPNTLPHITLDAVRSAIQDDEFKLMAPQLYLGLQFSAILSSLPDITREDGVAAVERVSDILRGGANPWARMLDDEDFNEEFVFGMYGMALDTWQRASYEDMTKRFHLSLTAVHTALRPPFKLELLRRVTRLVLARAEHVPPLDYYNGSYWMRSARRRIRQFRRQPDPSELGMVPLLDLVNHSNRPNVGIRVGPSPALNGAGAITLFSLAQVQPGQELCRHYNFAISRPNALFRYGFLPFDLISIVDHDAIDEYLVKNRDMLKPMSQEKIDALEREDKEVSRLEKLFKDARHETPDASVGDRVPRRKE